MADLTDREKYIYKLQEYKSRFGWDPWRWDHNYEIEMYGVYYQEDIGALEQIYELIVEGAKSNKKQGDEY